MFKTLRDAFKVKEIRMGLLFTFFVLIVIRFGSLIPVPGLNTVAIKEYLESALGDANSFLSSFTGGSFTQMSIFALNVTPYITSSIIIQLLTIAIPALEEMQKDGEDGRKKITAITRYVTIFLAVIESLGLVIGFDRGHYMTVTGPLGYLLVIITLTTGSAFVMWLGERVTEKGVGNGISIILLINIVSRMPSDFSDLYTKFMKGQDIVDQVIAGAIILAVILVTTILVVLLQGGVRKIPVQHAQKVQGRRMMGGQQSHIHFPECLQNFAASEFFSKLLFQQAVHQKADVTGHEVSLNPVISSDIHRSGFEFSFHDSEVLFNFPALPVNLYNLPDISLKICHNRIETIVKFFFGNLFLIKLIYLLFCNFAIVCYSSLFHKAHRIILIFPLSLFAGRTDNPLCALNLA